MSSSSAITVGNFDGVHLGHRLLLAELKRISSQRALTPVVVTFSCHPLTLIAPERAPLPLQTSQQRRADIEALGIEVIELPFNEELRLLSASDFLKMLRKRFHASVLLLGHDNRFGYRPPQQPYSVNDKTYWLDYYSSLDTGLEIIPSPELPGISSSTIRKALVGGDVRRGGEMLGHPYRYSSVVIQGRQLGRTIGFPTANLDLTRASTMLPGHGVYICNARVQKNNQFPALVNIGCRPTVDKSDAAVSVEVHLDGFSDNLYGQSVEIEFLERLRGEMRFESIEELRLQLLSDLSSLRQFQLPAL